MTTNNFKMYCKSFNGESLKVQLSIILHNATMLITCIALLIWNSIKRFPWIFFCITFTAFFIYFMVQLGKARSERDSYSKRNVELMDSIHKLNRQKIAYENY